MEIGNNWRQLPQDRFVSFSYDELEQGQTNPVAKLHKAAAVGFFYIGISPEYTKAIEELFWLRRAKLQGEDKIPPLSDVFDPEVPSFTRYVDLMADARMSVQYATESIAVRALNKVFSVFNVPPNLRGKIAEEFAPSDVVSQNFCFDPEMIDSTDSPHYSNNGYLSIYLPMGPGLEVNIDQEWVSLPTLQNNVIVAFGARLEDLIDDRKRLISSLFRSKQEFHMAVYSRGET